MDFIYQRNSIDSIDVKIFCRAEIESIFYGSQIGIVWQISTQRYACPVHGFFYCWRGQLAKLNKYIILIPQKNSVEILFFKGLFADIAAGNKIAVGKMYRLFFLLCQ